MSHELSERPPEPGERLWVGDWDGGIVTGRAGGACLLTMFDRTSGCLVSGKSLSKRKGAVRMAMSRTGTTSRSDSRRP